MLAAMLVIGAWITARIEDSVVSNTASAGALYLESFVSPLSQELAANDRLSEPAIRALDEVFAASGLGQRIVSFKIWKPGGLIAHASDPGLIGAQPELLAQRDGLGDLRRQLGPGRGGCDVGRRGVGLGNAV